MSVEYSSGPGDAGTAPPQVRVFVLDDHEMVRRGVRDLLSGEPGIEVVGEAGLAAEALRRIPALSPDVAVLDNRLPDGSGVEVCREIRSAYPDVHCLMFTTYDDEEALLGAIMAGAAGYVLKQVRGDVLVAAVRRVAEGQSLLDPIATTRVLARLRAGGQVERDPLAELTEQERKVLELIAEGLTNRQIGDRLFLAEQTVKHYVSSLLGKLGMNRRSQAAAFLASVRRR